MTLQMQILLLMLFWKAYRAVFSFVCIGLIGQPALSEKCFVLKIIFQVAFSLSATEQSVLHSLWDLIKSKTRPLNTSLCSL